MPFIDPKDILAATDGGLDIILQLYPQAAQSVQNRNRKFKAHDEKTASASLIKTADGTWIVTDFGEDDKSRNGILCYMKENNLDFPSALNRLAEQYQVLTQEEQEEVLKAKYSDRAAAAEEIEGTWTQEVRSELTAYEIETIVSKNVLKRVGWKSDDEKRAVEALKNIQEKFTHYHCHPLISYSTVKNRKVMTFTSTETYPIFLIDEGTHKKIYQPKHPKKEFRFMYVPGTKPKDFIHGMAQLNSAYEINKEEAIEKAEVKKKEGKDVKVNEKDYLLKDVTLCTGFSDAINVALCGYRVIWLNSETAKLHDKEFNHIMTKVKKLYNLSDIDATGKNAAHNLALKFLTIYNIELPEDLKVFKDRRGNFCKDVRDYFNNYHTKEYDTLVQQAKPYRFWEESPQFNRNGDFKKMDYELNVTLVYNFLQKNGFYRMLTGDMKTEYFYIRIIGNTVHTLEANDVRNWLNDFLEERQEDLALRNMTYLTPRLNESSLSNLKFNNLEFLDYDQRTQYLFFTNATLEITAQGVRPYKPGVLDRYIRAEDVINHSIVLAKDEPFTITCDNLGIYDIVIHDKECMFLKYLIQTSRVHWRKELETGEKFKAMSPSEQEAYELENRYNFAGPNLTDEEIGEQKKHLVNKIFAIGYLMHRYKDDSSAWMVYAMDGHTREDFLSHGGSGKSILFNVAMKQILKTYFTINGRDTTIDKNTHKYDGVTEHHRYLVIEDAHQYLNLDTFFNDVTGGLEVNPKGKAPYSISFEKSPKFALTTNFAGRNLGGSTLRRILYTVFSDYFHEASEANDYKETRTPRTQFGKNLIKQFNNDEHNSFYNVMISCLRFFLSVDEKISPAMDSVTKRTLLERMGPNFHDWALAYFSEEGENTNKFIVRTEAFSEFETENPGKWTPQSFLDRLKAFCKLYNYTLNPSQFQNKDGKIIQKHEPKYFDKLNKCWRLIEGQPKKAKEMIYVQTTLDIPDNVQPPTQTDPEIKMNF